MTNEPIDVAAFVAQLADDEHVGRELADMAEATLAPHEPDADDAVLDRLVSRALAVALECQLRGLSALSDGEQYEAELRASFAAIKLPDPASGLGGMIRRLEQRLRDTDQ